MAYPQGGSPSTVSRRNWNLEMLVFVEVGKPENLAKNPQSRDKNQPQTQHTDRVNSRIRAWTRQWEAAKVTLKLAWNEAYEDKMESSGYGIPVAIEVF